MDVLEGNRNGSKIYVDQNQYTYTLEKTLPNGTRYYRCRKKFCKGRVVIKSDNVVNCKGEHMHRASSTEIEKAKFLTYVKKEARSTLKPIKTVFNEAQYKNETGALAYGSYKSLKSTLFRNRRKSGIPPVPRDLQHYAKLLQNPKYCNRFAKTKSEELPFFSKHLTAEDNSEIVVFLSPKIRDYIRRHPDNIELHADATFKVVPLKIGAKQLFCLHVMIEHTVYPIIYCLMQNRTTASYKAVLQHLKTELPEIEKSVSCMTDYEAALRNALKEVLPNVLLRGCWFHYCRALTKQLRSLREKKDDPEIQLIIRMSMAIPCLPSDKTAEGFDLIKTKAANFKELENFVTYLHKTWKNQNISVYGLTHRTNNSVESFHNNINQLIYTRNKNVWFFTESLIKIEHFKSCDLYRVLSGVPSPKRKEKYKLVDNHIRQAEKRLMENGEIGNFLKAVGYQTREMFSYIIENKAYDEDEMEVEEFPDLSDEY